MAPLVAVIMLINRREWPKHRGWVFLVVLLAVASLAFYLAFASYAEGDRWPGGSSLPGLVLGAAAAGLIFFELLLWPRRWPRVRAWRIGRTQLWLRAHIWLGLLTAPLVVLHHGLSFEWGGALTTGLMICFWGVILSGVVGLWLQQTLPSYLLQSVPAESIASQLRVLSKQMVEDAERLLARPSEPTEPAAIDGGAGDRVAVFGAVRSVGRVRGKVLETQTLTRQQLEPADAAKLTTAFEQTIRPYLLEGRRNGVELGKKTQASTYFSALRGGVRGDAAEVVDRLHEYCDVRRQFDQQASVHLLLHGWLCLHLPLSLALAVLLLAHTVSAIRYAGIWPI